MEQQNNKTMECYRRMHQRLLEGIPADQIMREELETAFPFADDAERQQMMEGFLHSSRFFLSRMRDGQEERKATAKIWIERLDALDSREEQIRLLKFYRLLCEMTEMDEWTGKRADWDVYVQQKLKYYANGADEYEQVERLFSWACRNNRLEILFWEQQEEILRQLSIMSLEEAAKAFYSNRIETEEERALFACATLIEPEAKLGGVLQKIKTLTPEERSDLQLDSLAGIVSLFVNAALESEKVYVDLYGDLIHEEEAERLLGRIWDIVEEGLIVLVPALVSWLIACAVLVGGLAAAWALFEAGVITGSIFAVMSAGVVPLGTLGIAMVYNNIMPDIFERIFHRIGYKIHSMNHSEQSRLENNYTNSQRIAEKSVVID